MWQNIPKSLIDNLWFGIYKHTQKVKHFLRWSRNKATKFDEFVLKKLKLIIPKTQNMLVLLIIKSIHFLIQKSNQRQAIKVS